MSLIPLIDALTPVVQKALSFIPDPQQKAEQEQFLIGALKDWDAQQAQINVAEAQSPDLFVAGWRPFIGWVYGATIYYKFKLEPYFFLMQTASGSSFDYHALPAL